MGDYIMTDEFKIPPAHWPDEQRVIDAVASQVRALLAQQGGSGEVQFAIPPNVIKGMADIATNAWKARTKMLDAASGEVRDDMKRVFRHVEGIIESLKELGLETKDHTGEAFDYGLPLKVVTTQPKEGISREVVTETIRPTIYWQNKIIQMGEVVIATPISPSSNPTA